ncbi:MAG: hypothetical protein C3F02_04985 [Parcubacteria group bacterium]|nr:MAG: hypothetical protein C3F02_04985 [Parcubacteria group bacterium]
MILTASKTEESIVKWPRSLTFINSDNIVGGLVTNDPLYSRFVQAFEADPESQTTHQLAAKFAKKHHLVTRRQSTQLNSDEGQKAQKTGTALSKLLKLPQAIFLSPEDRTVAVWDRLCKGWPSLNSVTPRVIEDRLRRQSFGAADAYGDQRIYLALERAERQRFHHEGPYWYRWPEGENIADLRQRNEEWFATLLTDFSEKNLLIITDHTSILATMANIEGWSDRIFLRYRRLKQPEILAVTKYYGEPNDGREGKLLSVVFNETFWDV